MSGRSYRIVVLAAAVALLAARAAVAQGEPNDARSRAPLDLEGIWVSVVTEDWRWRMVTPAKGDYASVPLNAAGQAAASEWEPVDGEPSCLAFGAPALMRMPMHVRIRWADENTLELRTDRGRQTRIFRFDSNPPPAAPSRQGRSVATFDGTALKVVTDSLLPGWLRTNGVPYSDATRVTEYYNTHEAFGREGFTVTTIVHDPVYLQTDFVTSTTFWKVADDGDWQETPCREPASQ